MDYFNNLIFLSGTTVTRDIGTLLFVVGLALLYFTSPKKDGRFTTGFKDNQTRGCYGILIYLSMIVLGLFLVFISK